jgi:hypothetical protein
VEGLALVVRGLPDCDEIVAGAPALITNIAISPQLVTVIAMTEELFPFALYGPRVLDASASRKRSRALVQEISEHVVRDKIMVAYSPGNSKIHCTRVSLPSV